MSIFMNIKAFGISIHLLDTTIKLKNIYWKIKMLNKISLFLSMMLITTFSHSEPRMINVNYGLLNYTYKTTSYTASFIQWNDEYAVTAKHVKNLPNSVYICGVGCDLQFLSIKPVCQ